jgi:succinate-semialdehyde dehydrogenase/glutarate-semialdehyde dehydrogenase
MPGPSLLPGQCRAGDEGVCRRSPERGEPLAAWGQQGVLADIKVLPPKSTVLESHVGADLSALCAERPPPAARPAGVQDGPMNGLDLLGPDQRGLYIGGTWRQAEGDKRLDVIDPADGSVLTDVADASVPDAIDALDAAVAAQADWARTPPRERGEILRTAFEAITARADDFAHLMSLEMGKTVAEARGEVTYGAEFFRWYSEEAVRIHGRWMQAPAGGSRLLTIKKPVGPCLFITPWNFPLAMGTRKIGPAIAAGCTMVVKPASQTPLTMLALAGVLAEAGLPGGVLNVVTTSHTSEFSQALQGDERLRKVSFTGSTGVGKVLVRQSADQLQRLSMELGGNAPFLVFEDADVDAAVDGAMIAKMRNMGEACTAANRFLVHSSVAEEFSDKLAARMGSLTVGRGQTEGVDVGPLIDEKAVESVSRLVTDAVHDGARVVTGGSAPDGPGYFFEPTVLVDVPPGSEINVQEIFGPVAPITTFDSEDDAVRLANDTEYGLASYVYTRDLARTIRMAEALDFGMVGINSGLISNPAAPFGGVKHSGFGREGGFEGIEEYLETTYVALPAG